MSSRPTIKDIAAEAGVALGTASRALSGNGSIAAETRERMLAAAERLDFIPNAQARSLRSERTETMGLLIPDVRNPFFAELAHVVEREVRSSGLSVRLCNADEDPDLMRECTFGLTVGASASGCIATTSAPVDEDR
ncbi:MAG TPA: LacI family DNA-binding transcriptional regulator [Brevibacterium sp.]|nr:LacI family DNA-binding transcriptional regulator [Brevibacterium sp.]